MLISRYLVALAGAQMTFGQAISSARKAKQLSQRQLAQLIIKEDGTPISPQYLNDIERDRRNPHSDLLIGQFAKILAVPEEYFYFLAHQIPPKYRGEAPSNPFRIQEAFEVFAKSYRRAENGKEQ
jgi:transcriptional regulator with XRE-family HTH domain